MENKKTNRSKAATMLFLIVTIIVTMGVLLGCGKREQKPDSENDTTEVVDVPEVEDPEDTDTTEDVETEDPVEVEPEPEVTEEPEEEPSDYIVREDGRIQPAVHYASIIELMEFVDTLELEEAVVLLYSEESNLIIYNGDSFETGENDVLYLYLPKKESSYTNIGVSIFEIVGMDNIYGISYIKENGSREFSIQLEYEDGTSEEFTANLILQ